VNKLILGSLALILFASYNFPKELDDKKASLDDRIKEKVKFLQESKSFSSINLKL